MGFLIFVVLLLTVDQAAKYWVFVNMKIGDTIPLLDGIFHITYVQNTGAAFGILGQQRILLATVTTVLIIAIIAFIIIKRPTNKLLLTSLVLIVAGGTGNLLDRVRLGYVIDFFDFRLINFAVFNTADCFVVIGAGLLAIYMLITKE